MSRRPSPRPSSDLQVCSKADNFLFGWNRFAGRGVVQGMGNKRFLGAAMLAAGLVLSGCGAGGGEDPTTTTTAVAREPANPWDLPLEQRPPLFDPCQDSVVAAVEAGVGTPMESDDEFTNNKQSGLKSCGWRNNETLIFILSTWKSSDEYRADPVLTLKGEDVDVHGRAADLYTVSAQSTERSCHAHFYTENGTVLIGLSLHGALREFRGTKLSEACEALDQVIEPVVPQIPEGDYR